MEAWTLHCSYPPSGSLEPTQACSASQRQLARFLSRQLFTHQGVSNSHSWQAAEPVADLAGAVPSIYNAGLGASHRGHVIQLRPGACWDVSEPRQIGAADVMRGFQRLCAPGHNPVARTLLMSTIRGLRDFDAAVRAELSPSASAAEFAELCRTTPIKGLVILDELTLVVECVHPSLEFANLLTLPAVAPEPEEHEAFLPGTVATLTDWCSSGPFRVIRHHIDPAGGQVVVMERNPAWDPASDPVRTTTAERVVATFGTDIDHVAEPTRCYREAVGAPWAGADDQAPPLAWALDAYVAFNHARRDGDAITRSVRSGIAEVLAGSEIADLLNLKHPEVGYRPPGSLYGAAHYPIAAPSGRMPSPDISTTRELVVLTPPGRLSETAELCWSRLEGAGWNVRRQHLEEPAYRDALATPGNAGWDLTVGDWSPHWLQYHQRDLCQRLFASGSSGNIGGYRSDEADRLMEAALETIDPQLVAQRWGAVMDLLFDDVAFVPITSRPLGSAWALDDEVAAPRMPSLGFRPDLTRAELVKPQA